MDMQAFDQVRQLAAEHYLVRSLHVAADLGVADLLGPAAADVGGIASQLKVDTDSLVRILRLLASRGIFRVDGTRLSHSPASEFLRADHPMSLKSFVRMFGQQVQWDCAGDLGHSVATGEAVVARVLPEGSLWEYFAKHPAQGRVFDEAMAAKSSVQTADVLASYEFAGCQHVVDIGGGAGHMLQALLAHRTDLRGTLFDLPPVIEAAKQANTQDRLDFVEGDFIDEVTLPGADCAVLMEVLHDWDDAHCAKILAAVRRSLVPGARLVVVEIEMPEGQGPDWPKLLDIVMLTHFAARQRTNAEYTRLLAANGFDVARQISTPTGLTILEAWPSGVGAAGRSSEPYGTKASPVPY